MSEGRAGLPAPLPAGRGVSFHCFLFPPLTPDKAAPSAPRESLVSQGCESCLSAALPAGSLLSLLQIRHPQPRIFSLRCLFRKEFSLGTSHTHPGGFARFSREWFHKVATCHLWAERGNCSPGCAGEPATPSHNICGARAVCQALPSS